MLFDPLAVFTVACCQRRGPFLQCLVSLRAADGDHRLLGEGPQQSDLTLGKAAAGFSIEHDRPDRLTVSQEWHPNKGVSAQGDDRWVQTGIVIDLGNIDDLTLQNRPPDHGVGRWLHWEPAREGFDRFIVHVAVVGPHMQEVAVILIKRRGVRIAKFMCTAHDQLEDGVQVHRRGRHHFEHVDGGGLLLDPFAIFAIALGQRFGAFVQCAIRLGAADCDHRLLGEGFQQLDLAVGEAAGFRDVERNAPNRSAVAQQRQR